MRKSDPLHWLYWTSCSPDLPGPCVWSSVVVAGTLRPFLWFRARSLMNPNSPWFGSMGPAGPGGTDKNPWDLIDQYRGVNALQDHSADMRSVLTGTLCLQTDWGGQSIWGSDRYIQPSPSSGRSWSVAPSAAAGSPGFGSAAGRLWSIWLSFFWVSEQNPESTSRDNSDFCPLHLDSFTSIYSF